MGLLDRLSCIQFGDLLSLLAMVLLLLLLSFRPCCIIVQCRRAAHLWLNHQMTSSGAMRIRALSFSRYLYL